MTETAEGRLGRRLRRILVLLPYAIRHPGVSVGELAKKFGVQEQELIDDLNLVFLCGLPGYGPGDLIDATIDDDRVYVRMADYFSTPLRFTPAEALALLAGGEAMLGLPGMQEADSLERALAKLGRALGAAGRAGIGSRNRRAARHGPVEAPREPPQSRSEKEARASSTTCPRRAGSSPRERSIPGGSSLRAGRWYVVAWDHLSEDERMFRADRIKKVKTLRERADVPEDFSPETYKTAFRDKPEDQEVTFEISKDAARWFEDYYPVRKSKELRGGWKRVTLATSGDRWPALLVLRLGKDVRKIEPESVRETAETIAAGIASRHGCN